MKIKKKRRVHLGLPNLRFLSIVSDFILSERAITNICTCVDVDLLYARVYKENEIVTENSWILPIYSPTLSPSLQPMKISTYEIFF